VPGGVRKKASRKKGANAGGYLYENREKKRGKEKRGEGDHVFYALHPSRKKEGKRRRKGATEPTILTKEKKEKR